MEYPFKDLLPLDEVLEREGYYKDWTHLDPEVFYSLTQISNFIKTKGYGVDVRLLIAQLAEHFGLKTTQVVDLANLLQQKFTNLEGVTQSFTNNINSLVAQMQADKDAVIANATVDSEVILARVNKAGKSFMTLKERIDNQEIFLSSSSFDLESDGVADTTANFNNLFDYAKNNNGTILLESGMYYITEPFEIPSNVNVIGLSDVTLVFEVNGEFAIRAKDVSNASWSNVKIKRIGTPPTTSLGNHSALVINGQTNRSFRLEDVEVINEVQPFNGTHNVSTRAIHIYDYASPILSRVVGRGGGANTIETGSHTGGISIGAMLNSCASPTLYDCIGYAGAGISDGIELDNTIPGTHARLFNCVGHGNQTHQTSGISIDDVDQSQLYNCSGIVYTTNSMALSIYATASPFIQGGHFVSKGKGGYAIRIDNGAPILSDIIIESRTSGVYINNNARPKLNNIRTIIPYEKVMFINADNISAVIELPNDDEFIISNIELLVFRTLTSGTMDIGTTVGGNDIVSNYDLTSPRGWQGLAVSKEEKMKARAVGTQLFITFKNATGLMAGGIHLNIITEYTRSGGIGLASTGAEISNSTIIVGYRSIALTVSDRSIDANQSLITNSYFETKANLTNTQENSVFLAKEWIDAPFENVTVKGKVVRYVPKGKNNDYIFKGQNLVAGSEQILTINGNTSVLVNSKGYLSAYRMIVSHSLLSGNMKIIIRDKQNAKVLHTSTLISGNYQTNNFSAGIVDKVFNSVANIEVVLITSADFAMSATNSVNFNLTLSYN